ncbi:TonB family protein [Terricaulis sp.]|uniref:TonB family protein n=1 Tax=Terricaulis sp. TaxID=2768686 RepID=UPI002AC791A9|nr:TonB family protein [Terricaulis sp.]MDZ4691984.1 TonB family protein [Terricaulis sp.]
MQRLVWAQLALLALISAGLAAPVWAQKADLPAAAETPAPPQIEFPVAVDPPPAPPNPNILTNVVWLDRPNAREFLRVYPAEAQAEGLDGQATLDCLVAADGRLSCAVAREEPPGRGFGEAAIRAARHFRMAPVTRDNIATAGGRTRLTLRFRADWNDN